MAFDTGLPIALSTTTARNASAMAVGVPYIFSANADCWILQGGSGVEATLGTAGELFVKSGSYIPVISRAAADGYVAAILAAGAGLGSLTVGP